MHLFVGCTYNTLVVCMFMTAIKAMVMQLSLGNFFGNLGLKGKANPYNSAGIFFYFVFLELPGNKITKKEYLILTETVKKVKA